MNPSDPAFPVKADIRSAIYTGMDLRTYIATKVFCAMLTDLTDLRSNSDMADDAIIRADALIAALNKKP